MLHHVLIRWFAEGRSEWLSMSREGSVLQGPLPGLPDAAAEQVSLLLPAEEVLLLEAPRVARSSAQLAQALPFAIEESLASPVESVHVAFAERAAGDTVPVAVVAKSRLQAALDALAAAGLSADAAYSELQCLPWHDGQATLLVEGRRVLLRAGRSLGLAFDHSELDSLADWLARSGIDPAAAERVELAEGEALGWLVRQRPDPARINLLQGEFAPRRRRAAAVSQWRWAAVLAAAAILLAVTQLAVERQALEQHVLSRQSEMEQLFRQALPEVQRVVDPVAQMRAALRSGPAAGGDALALLARISPVLNSGSQLVIDAIEYRAGSLELVVMGPDVATLDSLRERLSSLPALQVELADATPGSRGVQGRLRIRESGA